MRRRERIAIEDEDFIGDGDEVLGDDGHALQVRLPFSVEAGVLFAHDDARHGAVRLCQKGAVVDGPVDRAAFGCAAIVTAADESEARVEKWRQWAEREDVPVEVDAADFLDRLPAEEVGFVLDGVDALVLVGAGEAGDVDLVPL